MKKIHIIIGALIFQCTYSVQKGLKWPIKNTPQFTDIENKLWGSHSDFHTEVLSFSNFKGYEFTMDYNHSRKYGLMYQDEQTVFVTKRGCYAFQWIYKSFNELKDIELQLAKYYNAEVNSKIKFMYANGYPKDINSLWGLKIDQKPYVTVWVNSEDTNDKRKFLVDKDSKILAIKTADGVITFQD